MTVVVATRDRREELLRTLDRLATLPERPPVIVVDNGSSDGTVDAVRRRHTGVAVVELGGNHGAVARNAGVALATTPYVAFSDDDSWWAPGALHRAADLLDGAPRLALVAARILVGPEERLDPVCPLMAASPLPAEPDVPGPPVLGFLACGSVVRRSAFLAAGGFDDVLGFAGEEQLLALDLAAAGWVLSYADDVVAHHHPSPSRQPRARQVLQARNDLLTAWMRRPLPEVWRRTAALTARAGRNPVARAALADAARRLPRALARRRRLPPRVEAQVRLLEA